MVWIIFAASLALFAITFRWMLRSTLADARSERFRGMLRVARAARERGKILGRAKLMRERWERLAVR